jgi:hypothetical protein
MVLEPSIDVTTKSSIMKWSPRNDEIYRTARGRLFKGLSVFEALEVPSPSSYPLFVFYLLLVCSLECASISLTAFLKAAFSSALIFTYQASHKPSDAPPDL